MKPRRAHDVPLSDQALAVLDRVRGMDDETYCFPSPIEAGSLHGSGQRTLAYGATLPS
jgi:hypothetical protein